MNNKQEPLNTDTREELGYYIILALEAARHLIDKDDRIAIKRLARYSRQALDEIDRLREELHEYKVLDGRIEV